MKPTTIILIIVYLILFSLGGYWFYKKYYHQVTVPEDKARIAIVPDKTIFYAAGNNLYQLNSDNLNKTSQDITTLRLQSTGEVNSVVVDQANQFFVYEVVTPKNTSEIWKVSFLDNTSEKLFSAQTPGLENFSEFRSPQISADGENLAFIATHQGEDALFSWKINDRSLQNLTSGVYQGKISSFCWDKIKTKIYLAADLNNQNIIKELDLQKKSENRWEGSPKITKMVAMKDKIIVIMEEKETANLGYIATSSWDKIQPLTDVVSPKKVSRFDLAPNGAQVVYQTLDATGSKNDLYVVKTDGTNLLQLTDDGKSQFPIFSPDSVKIAFWLKNSGIYTMQTDKQNKQKILNNEGKIDNIILWQ